MAGEAWPFGRGRAFSAEDGGCRFLRELSGNAESAVLPVNPPGNNACDIPMQNAGYAVVEVSAAGLHRVARDVLHNIPGGREEVMNKETGGTGDENARRLVREALGTMNYMAVLWFASRDGGLSYADSRGIGRDMSRESVRTDRIKASR